MKNIQKSVRLTEHVYNAIDGYRGDGFNEKLANLVTDYLERREQLQQDWNMLQAQVGDKRTEMMAIQTRVAKYREIDRRLAPLVDSLTDLLALN